MIPGSANALLLNSADSSYTIERSLRFNSGDSAYLSRTPSTAGNRKTWTWAGWVKKVEISGFDPIFSAGVNPWTDIGFNSDRLRCVLNAGSGEIGAISDAVFRDPSAWYHVVFAVDTTQAVAADRIKFYVNGISVSHVAGVSGYPTQNYDTYVNSITTHRVNADGQVSNGGIRFADCYLADIHFIDGQALDPTSFGEFDTNGIWQPIEYTGTYGANGFHLDFSDNSTAAALGTDRSTNTNNWAVNGFSVSTSIIGNYTGAGTLLDQAIDGVLGNSGTQNIAYTATFVQPIQYSSLKVVYGNMANGGLGNPATGAVLSINGSAVSATGTYGVSPYSATYNKYYETNTPGTLTSIGMSTGISGSHESGIFEIYVNGSLFTRSLVTSDSVTDSPTNVPTQLVESATPPGNYCTLNPLALKNFALSDGNLKGINNGANDGIAWGTFAIPKQGKWYWEATQDNTNGATYLLYTGITPTPHTTGGLTLSAAIYPRKDATCFYGLPGTNCVSETNTLGDVFGVAYDADLGVVKFYKNGVYYSGQDRTVDTALTYYPFLALGNQGFSAHVNFGQRPWAYQAPEGFKALCTSNLPAPVVTKPSTVFNTYLWSGNGGTQTISTSFSPDFVWVKQRDNTNVASYVLVDIVRGNNNVLRTNGTDAENAGGIDPALYDGVTNLSTASFDVVKGSSGTYNGTNGSGKSYVGWTWDAGSSTVTNTQGSISSQVRANPSAGFSVATYTTSGSGTVGHGLGVTPAISLAKRRNGTSAWYFRFIAGGVNTVLLLNTTDAGSGSSTFTSTVVNGADFGTANEEWVLYNFAPVAGYSAFGSYTGNGSTNGPFIYTEFRPRWILYKSTGATGWAIHDTRRSGYNVFVASLYPNGPDGEYNGAGHEVDILSNGFKLRNANSRFNTSGQTYIYAAFAENPFQYARAR